MDKGIGITFYSFKEDKQTDMYLPDEEVEALKDNPAAAQGLIIAALDKLGYGNQDDNKKD
jgi:hypothetical protein